MAILSKSTFIRGCKCLKSLYLYKNNYDLRDEISASQQAIFDQGHEVGIYAQKLFPEGVDASMEPRWDYKKSIQQTSLLLEKGCKIIYEAGFMFNDLYAALDILVIKKDGCYIYEVKSSTQVKDYNLIDAAVQYYILTRLGYKVKDISIVHINNEYTRKGNVDPKQLFTIESVLEDAKDNQAFVEAQLLKAQSTLKNKTMPDIEIGDQCDKFYPCDYEGHCWKDVASVEYPVTDISRIGGKALQLIEEGYLSQYDVPDDFPLTENQRLQVTSLKNKSVIFNNEEVKDFLGEIIYPVYYFDFETFGSAIPLFDDSRPYQQVPFQYSLHKKNSKNETAIHFEFLGDGKSDPRKALVEKMIKELGKKGSILCYNQSFEIGKLRELANIFPEHETAINNIIDRIVDLIIPFRSKSVYHWQMNGSASIKKVLPAFIPHLSYDELEIGEGGTASQSYLNLFVETDESVIAKTMVDLKEYCKLDTYAMVELHGFLENKIIEL